MTPNRRLDQLEPLMADALQKIDRLIEGQGQLVELTANIKVELDEVKGDLSDVKEIATKVDATSQITAKGLANLTTSSQKQFDELKAGQEALRTNQDQLKAGQEALRANQDQLKAGQEALRTNQDQLMANQELLKAGQDTIMQFLREKLP